MNETLIFFDLSNNITINHKYIKIVTIYITEYEYLSFIIIFVYNSSKLLAVCIFKLKNLPKEKFSYSIYIKVNEKG